MKSLPDGSFARFEFFNDRDSFEQLWNALDGRNAFPDEVIGTR